MTARSDSFRAYPISEFKIKARRLWLGAAHLPVPTVGQPHGLVGNGWRHRHPVGPASAQRPGSPGPVSGTASSTGGRRCRMQGWSQVARHSCRCRARSRARAEDVARKPEARSVMGLRARRVGKGKIDRMGDRAACAGARGCRPVGTHGRRLGLSGQERCRRRSRMIPFRKSRIESPSRRVDERGGRKPTHPALILCSRFYYLEIAVTLFCAPFPGRSGE